MSRLSPALTPIEMTADEFCQHVFVLPVRKVNQARGRKNDVSPEHRARLNRLEAVVSGGLQGESAYTGLLMDRLMATAFDEDLYWSSLPDGTIIVLAEESVYEQAGERRLVEEIHAAELERALSRGEDVPMELVMFYRNQPALQMRETMGEYARH
jgi:hypothetical protein